jgi:hypothetical protein
MRSCSDVGVKKGVTGCPDSPLSGSGSVDVCCPLLSVLLRVRNLPPSHRVDNPNCCTDPCVCVDVPAPAASVVPCGYDSLT